MTIWHIIMHMMKGGDSSRTGNFFQGNQGSTMGQSNEQGDVGSMQEREMGSHSPLTTQKGYQLLMD